MANCVLWLLECFYDGVSSLTVFVAVFESLVGEAARSTQSLSPPPASLLSLHLPHTPLSLSTGGLPGASHHSLIQGEH